MEITEDQFAKIKGLLPRQRGNVKLDNRLALNGMLHVLEQGCKWRALPSRYGRWHTVYMRMRRWEESDVLSRVFQELQRQGMMPDQADTASLDSTASKVHPDGTGALKKTGLKRSANRAGAGRPRSI